MISYCHIGHEFIKNVDIDMDNINQSVYKVFSTNTFVFTNKITSEIKAEQDIVEFSDDKSLDDILSTDVMIVNLISGSFTIKEIYTMYKQITNKELRYIII